jgi:hypothetical protein
MKKPTLEEVRNHFKDAKIVKCLSSYTDINLIESDIKRWVHIYDNKFWIDFKTEIDEDSILLWENGIGYAEIIKHKDGVKELSKYHVQCKGVNIDIYDVLKAFDVVNPATQHAIKKLLKGGQRGFKDVNKDYQEAIDSIVRAIELNK